MSKHIKYNLLLVDDDPHILELSRRVLSEAGYSVLSSTDAMDAHAMLNDLDLPIDLLLTDVHVPYMIGPELAREGVRRRPSLKVLFMSGDPKGRSYFRQEDQLLRKPFTMNELLRQVGQVLASQNGIAIEAETLPKTWEGAERRRANRNG